MSAEVSNFKRCLVAQALFNGSAPLLDVLRRRVQIERGEADRGHAQHRLAKVEPGGDEPGRRGKVIGLLGLREGIRNIVTLIAPGVHGHWRKKETKGPRRRHPPAKNVL